MSIHQQYQATLRYLYEQLPMFQRIGPAAFKKDLGNILALMQVLDHPHRRFPSLHIAGTNGKGSTAHLLAAGLQAQGYKTGLYTSPHYRDFRERIKIDGSLISKQAVVEFVQTYQRDIQRIQPSFFEITVAMAFDYFARSAIDMAVIEVGLGGRLDSTNIITPLLSIITNISFDHQQFLGDTLPQIAAEKAGIIKTGVPVVVGETQLETAPVFIAHAEAKNAPIYFADQHWQAAMATKHDTSTPPLHQLSSPSSYRVYKDNELVYDDLQVDLQGEYQHRNIQTALAAFDRLQQYSSWHITPASIRSGWRQLRTLTRFLGRWQVISEQPLVLVDSAHNEGGLKLVIQQLQQLPYRQLHIVMGTVNDKAVEDILPLFPKEARYYFAKADIPRGLDAQLLREKAAAFGLAGRAYTSVRHALRAAKRRAQEDDLIFIGGSIFVVAEVV